jgi:hypothetical protein
LTEINNGRRSDCGTALDVEAGAPSEGAVIEQ